MVASDDEFIFEIFLNGCFSKTAANIFILGILKSVFTWDFISGEIKYFHFGILSIPKRNSSQVLFHCGHFDRNEISFRLIKYVNATRNEIIWKETSAHAWTKLIGPYIMGRLYRTSPKTKFVSFRPQWKVMWTELVLWWVEISFRVDFILGLM